MRRLDKPVASAQCRRSLNKTLCQRMIGRVPILFLRTGLMLLVSPFRPFYLSLPHQVLFLAAVLSSSFILQCSFVIWVFFSTFLGDRSMRIWSTEWNASNRRANARRKPISIRVTTRKTRSLIPVLARSSSGLHFGRSFIFSSFYPPTELHEYLHVHTFHEVKSTVRRSAHVPRLNLACSDSTAQIR